MSRAAVVALGLATACGPGAVAMTGDPTTTADGSTTADSVTGAASLPTSTASTTASTTDTTMPVLPDTSTGTSTGPTEPGTTTSTSTTDPADPSSSGTTHATGSSSGGPADTADTEAVCPEGTVVCIDDGLEICNGEGGFKHSESRTEPVCEYGCLDEFSCRSCEQFLADVACPSGLPRVMVLLDASSSMLNTNAGTVHAPPGEGGWDQVRDALTGTSSIFKLELDGAPLKERALVGLAVFGHNEPNEGRLLVDYGPCHEDAFSWALDPESACEAPGCVDPYGPPPIEWTFKDGSLSDPPGFAEPTFNHMPRCQKSDQLPHACVGSGTYLHLGLERIRDNLIAHKAACPQAALACTDETRFINILILDGKYNSTDAQVQAPLEAMFADGVVTHVIGFRDLVHQPQLAKIAEWGSGGQLAARISPNQDQLEEDLAQILTALDPC